jgi:hypothetical protein
MVYDEAYVQSVVSSKLNVGPWESVSTLIERPALTGQDREAFFVKAS